jgi:hypothetical protein
VLARQALYHFSHTFSLINFSFKKEEYCGGFDIQIIQKENNLTCKPSFDIIIIYTSRYSDTIHDIIYTVTEVSVCHQVTCE